MALKAVLPKTDYEGLDGALKPFYKSEGDRFVLDMEGFEDHSAARGLKSALDKERGAKAERERELNELRDKVGDLDPAKAREALKRIKEIEDAEKLGDIPEKFKKPFEEAVEHRTQSMRTDFENQKKGFEKKINDLGGEKQSLTEKLEELMIVNEVRSEAAKLGLYDWAIEDAVLRARQVYHIKDGKPIPIKPGTKDEILWGKNPQEPKPIAEWLSDATAERPGWVKDSNGGGARNDPRLTGGKVYKIKREDARDTTKYQAAKEAAKKSGQTLEIVD